MNKSTLEKLQYNDLKERVKTFCVSGLGKELIDKLEPSSNIRVVKNRLSETSEGRCLLEAYSYVPLEGISNINNIVTKIEKGLVLEPGELLSISDFLRGCRKIKEFMKSKDGYAPTLSSYADSITEFLYIEEEINYSIKGNRVDSAASKELKKIRRLIDVAEGKIEEKLNKFLKSSLNKEFIQEFFISKRNDRFTIPIKVAHKNKVDGTIVETSSKGSTVFIEPSSVSKLNLELVMLKSEEAAEEYQILATLTGIIFERIREIKINQDLIAQYDMVFAKAKYSKAIGGIEPKINSIGFIKLRKCNHPLLEGDVVPLDLEIGKDYRSLIITGPNAGGKTVVLKTLGLLTLSVQSGLHIVGKEGTEIAIFDNVFVDIGDNQSIENALSTFSSHMKNLAEIISCSNKNTLLLFDEIGSGTEPNEGAALAIAILEEFYHMGCITVASTHYGEIKRFSENHSDFENAAMQFKSETLEPLYKLVIGRSGESNALWISKKMGIRDKILERAKGYMESNEYNYDLVRDSKVSKEREVAEEVDEGTSKVIFEKGDRVLLLDKKDYAIVYDGIDDYNNIKVLYKKEIIEVNARRLTLDIKGSELYPEGYDLNSLFVSYKEMKFERDIKRGSKKALKKLQKEMKK